MDTLSQLKKGTPPWYEAQYKSLAFDPGYEAEILQAAKLVLAGKDRYLWVQDQTGVPWRVVGCLHNMEASCNFRGCLHNGDHCIGNGQKTHNVPAGRGPFATWEMAALDALKLDGLSALKPSAWTLGLELQKAEQFNGTGYLRFHPDQNSPYIWACSTINSGHGKYVADGKYDGAADTHGEVGVATIYKQLEMLGQLGPVNFSS